MLAQCKKFWHLKVGFLHELTSPKANVVISQLPRANLHSPSRCWCVPYGDVIFCGVGVGADWDDSLGFQSRYEDEKHLHWGTEGGAVAASNLLCSLLTVFNTLLILLNILIKKLELCLGWSHNENIPPRFSGTAKVFTEEWVLATGCSSLAGRCWEASRWSA